MFSVVDGLANSLEDASKVASASDHWAFCTNLTASRYFSRARAFASSEAPCEEAARGPASSAEALGVADRRTRMAPRARRCLRCMAVRGAVQEVQISAICQLFRCFGPKTPRRRADPPLRARSGLQRRDDDDAEI